MHELGRRSSRLSVSLVRNSLEIHPNNVYHHHQLLLHRRRRHQHTQYILHTIKIQMYAIIKTGSLFVRPRRYCTESKRAPWKIIVILLCSFLQRATAHFYPAPLTASHHPPIQMHWTVVAVVVVPYFSTSCDFVNYSVLFSSALMQHCATSAIRALDAFSRRGWVQLFQTIIVATLAYELLLYLKSLTQAYIDFLE